jgi:hypothetical protein
MKKQGKILSLAVSAALVFGSVCLETGEVIDANSGLTITSNRTGTYDGYDYEYWMDGGSGTMTLTGGGSFTCTYNASSNLNVLMRTGKKFDSTKNHSQIGNISMEYECDYSPGSGAAYLCVYGWSKANASQNIPLVEYYIVEAWGEWRPPGATSKGTVSIDGGTYDIYETIRENMPSIEGNTTFKQYWSVRTSKKTQGTISVSKHFEAWEAQGMKMGNLYEVALCIEGYNSTGTANVKKNILTIGGAIPTTPTPTGTTESIGTYPLPGVQGFYDTFDNSSPTPHGWSARGTGVSIGLAMVGGIVDSPNMSVTGRTEEWHGIEKSLSGYATAGGSYSISSWVKPMSGTQPQVFKLTLQYNLNGEDNWDTIATGEAGSSWTLLENLNYTIPTGATDLLLYVEAENPTLSFAIDSAWLSYSGRPNPASTPEQTTPTPSTTPAPTTNTTATPTPTQTTTPTNTPLITTPLPSINGTTPAPTTTPYVQSPTPVPTYSAPTPTPQITTPTITDVNEYSSDWGVPTLKGDVNSDGSVDIADVILLSKYLVGKSTLTNQQKANANVESSSTQSLDVNDTFKIVQYIAKIITVLD